MRRIFLTAVALAALALAVPAVATAHHHSSRAASHHRRHHHARIVRFGAPVTTSTTTSPTPTMPTTPTPAGTVMSFKEGVLTITLADGSNVSGKVTERTGLDCVSEESAPTSGHDDQGGGDDPSGRLSGENGGPKFGHKSDWQGGEDQGGDQDEDDQGTQPPCTTEQLVPGTKIAAAELFIGMGGSVWEEIVLIK